MKIKKITKKQNQIRRNSSNYRSESKSFFRLTVIFLSIQLNRRSRRNRVIDFLKNYFKALSCLSTKPKRIKANLNWQQIWHESLDKLGTQMRRSKEPGLISNSTGRQCNFIYLVQWEFRIYFLKRCDDEPILPKQR